MNWAAPVCYVAFRGFPARPKPLVDGCSMTDLPIGLCRSDHPNDLSARINAPRLCSLTLIEELATQGATR